MSMYGTTGQEDDEAKRELQTEYENKYGKRIENAWVILDHWVSYFILFFKSFIFIFCLFESSLPEPLPSRPLCPFGVRTKIIQFVFFSSCLRSSPNTPHF